MGTAIDISHLRSIKDRFSFEDKKGFVTGAAGGIGRSTAAALAELGADVALVDINLEHARQNAEEINKRFGTHCIALRCDVSDPNSDSTMMAEVLRAYGEVNFVHSNAGIISPDDNGDMPLESWNRMRRQPHRHDARRSGLRASDEGAGQGRRRRQHGFHVRAHRQ